MGFAIILVAAAASWLPEVAAAERASYGECETVMLHETEGGG